MKLIPNQTSTATSLPTLKIWGKISLVDSQISVLQAIIKKEKEKKERKYQQRNISPAGFQPGGLIK